ncbi:Crp/Fnr family transcriptional regulator [Paracoccus sp. CPCC 101403]|uniref:Crp/Fnr family transcriptional regulator n=2 Tax=Paracoccus broussonetiae TaxID=3075834 RepID=A0ABU3ECL9_9RHOB|nr:Crp/Fnr family transcriptional regulator [Paracoccus sp. CPCC 101403]MDT1061978.1 Crp/Fnr family transcriptional regulator [Paracoccus sp. CPCC 101403]
MTQPAAGSPLISAEILDGLTLAQKRAFIAECQFRSFRAARDILWQGERTEGFFLVEQGQVEVTYIDDQGNSIIVHIAGPGEVLGEVEALSGKPCAATCRAMANSRVLYCTTAQLLKHVPARTLVTNLASVLLDKLVRDNRQRSLDHFLTADQRICVYLQQFTTPGQPELRINQTYLAALAGCSRQTVNRKLNELRLQGIIDISRGRITVLLHDRLSIEPEDAPRRVAGAAEARG